ncbi:MAG: Asp23/Gls24 family envelope stress response protein [Chloroflexi bacterium]|nr:Asp23/Gls24 family envelope stress response protein [Chloroflexota bacterium]
MTDYPHEGKTTMTLEVLMTIASMTALGVDGVAGMARVRGAKGLFKSNPEGVLVQVEDGVVLVDLYLLVNENVNIREVGREVQQHVARAITEMTGLEVGHVNIHVEDIVF